MVKLLPSVMAKTKQNETKSNNNHHCLLWTYSMDFLYLLNISISLFGFNIFIDEEKSRVQNIMNTNKTLKSGRRIWKWH